MLKGFAITPVVTGRVSIGEIVEQGGRRLPKKLDHIVLTGEIQVNGAWREHPLQLELLAAKKAADDPNATKLHSIPVRILFDTPENNFRAEYTCFDDKGRPVCSGDGEKANRRTSSGMASVDCPGSDICEFGAKNRCKQFGRLIVGMESYFANDPLSGFMFRTTSFNSIRAITARLKYLYAMTGGRLSGLPCNLRMRFKSTAASYRQPIAYIDLEPANGLMAAVKVMETYRKECQEAGLSLRHLDESVTKGISESSFYEDSTDGVEVKEEFYATNSMDDIPEEGHSSQTGQAPSSADNASQPQSKLPESEIPSGDICTTEQMARITDLLASTGTEVTRVLSFLQKQPGTALETLTPQEADRAVQALSNMKQKPALTSSGTASAPSEQASSAAPTGESANNNGSAPVTTENEQKAATEEQAAKTVATASGQTAPQGTDGEAAPATKKTRKPRTAKVKEVPQPAETATGAADLKAQVPLNMNTLGNVEANQSVPSMPVLHAAAGSGLAMIDQFED